MEDIDPVGLNPNPILSLDSDPERAARAHELSLATGVGPATAYSDLDNIERKLKTELVGSIIDQNPHLQEYLKSNPLAEKVSNDDYGNLDTFSKSARLLAQPSGFLEGFKAGFDYEGLQREYDKLLTSEDWFSKVVRATPLAPGAVIAAGMALRAPGAVMTGIAGSLGQAYENLGGNKAWADRFTRDILAGLQVGLSGQAGLSAPGAIAKLNSEIRPYLRAGKEPPPGVNPVVDILKGQNVEAAIAALEEVVSAAQGSATRERAPELFTEFVRKHFGEAAVGIPADIAAQFEADLAWVPRLREQLEVAARTGGDVEIPLADFVAKVQPELLTALRDHIRVRPELPTKEEIAIPRVPEQPEWEAYHGTGAEVDFGVNFRIGEASRLEEQPAFFALDPDFANAWTDVNKAAHARSEAAREISLAHNKKMEEKYGWNWRDKMTKEERLEQYGLMKAQEAAQEPPEGAAGPRVIPVRIRPGKTATLDMEKLFAESEDFHSALRAVFTDPAFEHMATADRADSVQAVKHFEQRLEEKRGEYTRHQEQRKQILEETTAEGNPVDIGPWKAPMDFIAAAVKMAKDQGLDTALLTNLSEGGEQLIVFNKDNIRPRYTDPVGQATEVVRKAAGLEEPVALYFDLWHGSAQEFQKFSREKIGSGEGQQDQGFGFYLAERKEAAGDYRNALSTESQDQTASRMVNQFGSPADAQKIIERREGADATKNELWKILERWKSEGVPTDIEPPGYLYRVRVNASKEHFLDWDKPVADQHPIVRRALEDLGVSDQSTGAEAYYRLMGRFDGEIDASGALEKLGVAGIRYLDEGSRAAGEGTRNYVVFDENLLEITHKNGNPVYPEARAELIEPPKEPVPATPTGPVADAFTSPQTWMTVDQFARYNRALEAQRVADEAAALRRAESAQRKRMSAEWKEKRKEVQAEVAEQFGMSGVFAADGYFREGILYGKPINEPLPRIGREFISDEAAAALPPSFLSKTGIDPELVAGLFGYPDGQTMIYDLAQLHAERTASKKNAPAFQRAALEAEINRVMEQRHGDFGDQVLEAAKEQALSEAQMQVLHEKTLALAEKVGAEFPITRADFSKIVDEAYESTIVKEARSDKFIREAGTAFRRYVDAALRGDFAEMFRWHQRHYAAAELAQRMVEFEKDKGKFERAVKKFQKRDPTYTDEVFAGYIQRMLQQAGYKIRLAPDEVQAAIDFHGQGTLQDFVADHLSTNGSAIYMPEWLYEGVKPVKDMTLAEFADFREAVKSMIEHGREAKLILDRGKAVERRLIEDEVIAHVEQFPVVDPERLTKSAAGFDAAIRRPERVLADLDRHEELGPLTRLIAYPLARAKAFEFDKMKWLREYFEKAGKANTHLRNWQAKLGEVIQQDLFTSPYDGQPMHFTRSNLLQVMLHMGSDSNMGALARGYARLKLESLGEKRKPTRKEVEAYATAIKDFVDQHATKEDWQSVELLWGVFKELQPLSDTVQRNVDKTKPAWIEARPFDTPHGQISGGYWPVNYTKVGLSGEREAVKVSPAFAITNRLVRGSTSKMFLKQRVVNFNPVDLTGSLENAAAIMQQHIHYIAYAEELATAAKLMNSKRISEAIKKHYGGEYYNTIASALNDVAYKYPHEHEVMDSLNKVLQWSRTSLANNVLPLNLTVLAGLDIGVPNPVVWGRYLADWRANSKLAETKSREIKQMLFNIDRDFREQLDAYFKANRVDRARARAIEWSLTPMVWLNKPYRKATFVEYYKDALARGLPEEQAIDIADAKVRHRFGASGTFDLPAIMRQGEHWKLSTVFYHWFSTQYNMLRDVPANMRYGNYTEAAANVVATIGVGTATGALIFNPTKKDDSLWTTWGKALLLHPVSLIPFAREATSYLMYGQAPNTPAGSVFKSIHAVYKDAWNAAEGKPVKKPIQHAATAAGFVARLPGYQIGKTGQFLADTASGKQRPQGFMEWLRGIRTGEAKLK